MNLSALNNITPLQLNISLINNSENIVSSAVSTANEVTDNYLGLGLMITFFLFMLFILYDKNDQFRQSITKSLVQSSGLTLIIGIIMIVSGLITDYRHVIWFAIIFAVAIVARKKTNVEV